MSTAIGRVVCLGDLMIDVMAVLDNPLSIGSDTPAPIEFRHGGAAANTAAWLAELGVPASFVGRVGDDAFGRSAVEVLASHGVRVLAGIDGSAATGVCIVLVGSDGERTMIPSAGANENLSVANLPELVLEAGDRLHVSGYSLISEGSRDAARFAIRRASDAGVPITVDAASADPIRHLGAETFLAMVEPSATLLANHDETSVLTGITDSGLAAMKLSERFAGVVVKRGARGATVAQNGVLTEIPTEEVEVIDSTGAGDAFAAGVLAALHGGADLVAAVRLGNQLGARAVAALGARPRST
ncbi:carbohydrate kinase family protein [Jatrophihabitans sp. DSM 45814]